MQKNHKRRIITMNVLILIISAAVFRNVRTETIRSVDVLTLISIGVLIGIFIMNLVALFRVPNESPR